MDLGGDFSSWLQPSGPRNGHQMGDISVMDAARRLVGARGSPSRRNRRSADAPIKTQEGKPGRLSACVSLQNISPASSFNFQGDLLFFRPPPASMLEDTVTVSKLNRGVGLDSNSFLRPQGPRFQSDRRCVQRKQEKVLMCGVKPGSIGFLASVFCHFLFGTTADQMSCCGVVILSVAR